MNPVFQAPANDEYDGGRDLKKVLCSQRTRAHLLKDLSMMNKMIRTAIAALALGGAATGNAALFNVQCECQQFVRRRRTEHEHRPERWSSKCFR
jgi:hypothetical protein